MSREPGESGANIPRIQSGSNSQRLLSALLADYTFELSGGLSSAAIVRILAEFGITAAGARAALSRVTSRGLLVPVRSGRQISYAIGDESRAIHHERLAKIVRFGEEDPRWDGQWTVVVFSVAESQRTLRAKFRLGLERAGLASLTDAVWITPHDRRTEAASLGAELGVTAAVMRASFDEPVTPGLRPVDAFDLAAVRELYDTFIDEYGPIAVRAREGLLEPAEALVVRTEVLKEWRHIALTDPALPAHLLASDWPLARARAIFVDLWGGIAPLALLRLRQLIGEYDQDAAAKLNYITLDGF